SIGVIKVDIYEGANLADLDLGDLDKVFLTLSMVNDPKSSVQHTRILSDNINPVWNETMLMLITEDDIENGNEIQISVRDQSKIGVVNKMVGVIRKRVSELIEMNLFEEQLLCDGWEYFDEGAQVIGEGESRGKVSMHLPKIRYRMTFHPKYPREKLADEDDSADRDLLDNTNSPSTTDQAPVNGNSANVFKSAENDQTIEDATLNNATGSQNIYHEAAQISTALKGKSVSSENSSSPLNNRTDDMAWVSHDPVRPLEEDQSFTAINSKHSKFDHTPGILCIQVHQAIDVEISDPSFTDQEHPYDHTQPPNPYANIFVNDTKVYKTRTKMHSTAPFWNVSTEQFINDFDNATVRVTVKNEINMEHDPVLGMVLVRLTDVTRKSSMQRKQHTQWFPLKGGIGFGKIRISFLFKPVLLTLPRELCGFEVGTLEVRNIWVQNLTEQFTSHKLNKIGCHLQLNLAPVCEEKIHQPTNISENSIEYNNLNLRFPIHHRYQTGLLLRFDKRTFKFSNIFCATQIWLRNMLDSEWVCLNASIKKFEDEQEGMNMYLEERDDEWERERERERERDPNSVENDSFGDVKVEMRFIPGISTTHEERLDFRSDWLGVNQLDYTQNIKDDSTTDLSNDSNEEEDTNPKLNPNPNEDVIEPSKMQYYKDKLEGKLSKKGRSQNISKSKLARKLQWGKDKIEEKVMNILQDHSHEEKKLNVEKE
ncbi:hypothetical protein K7432_008068, partial [Basidiobolus ranarum]